MPMEHIRLYPPEPARAFIEGKVIVAVWSDQKGGEHHVVVLWERFREGRLYQFLWNDKHIPVRWLEDGGEEWRQFPDWGAALDDAHRWALELQGG